MGLVKAICISKNKGEKKLPVDKGELIKDFGVKNDAHAGSCLRQVSFLSEENIKAFEGEKNLIHPGDFGENIITSDIDLASLKVGDRLKIGDSAVAEVSQLGKECDHPCSIYDEMGDCIMPTKGIFARIIVGGCIKKGDIIKKLSCC